MITPEQRAEAGRLADACDTMYRDNVTVWNYARSAANFLRTIAALPEAAPTYANPAKADHLHEPYITIKAAGQRDRRAPIPTNFAMAAAAPLPDAQHKADTARIAELEAQHKERSDFLLAATRDAQQFASVYADRVVEQSARIVELEAQIAELKAAANRSTP